MVFNTKHFYIVKDLYDNPDTMDTIESIDCNIVETITTMEENRWVSSLKTNPDITSCSDIAIVWGSLHNMSYRIVMLILLWILKSMVVTT